MFGKGNLVVGGAAQEAGDPEEDYGAYDRGDEVADYAGSGDSEEAEEPAAEDATDDSDDEVDDPAEAAATHEFAGYRAGHYSDEYIPDEAHSEIILRFNKAFFTDRTSLTAVLFFDLQ